jgi:hypothetical protein
MVSKPTNNEHPDSKQGQRATRSTSTKSQSAVTWRGDRKKNRSDWIIHVVSSNNGGREIYHVHTKVVDKLSPRRISYFEPIFKDKMEHIGDRTSQLILPSEIAESFDKLLDFLYCADKKQEQEFLFNVKNGLALYKIAQHFEIEPMQNMLTSFYRDTTTPFRTLESNESAGNKLNSSKMVKSDIEQFAEIMHTLEFVDEIQLEPSYLLKALKKRKEMNLTKTKEESENISCLVALCTKHYKDKLTRTSFYKLTQEEFIPHIDQEAALQLLTVESELQFWTDSDNFSTLQARCIQSLLADWKGLRTKFESDATFWKTLRGLSPNVLGILLLQSAGSKQENRLSSLDPSPAQPSALDQNLPEKFER